MTQQTYGWLSPKAGWEPPASQSCRDQK
ncbi:rCG42588 [Rattus norvegicus]|uniref:RCG42588 n=1 Tax=Rattus norvegicus TaxID=10116 RepID=A6K163_RAT|nr:rCG42588 [Rattus norvegicus]